MSKQTTQSNQPIDAEVVADNPEQKALAVRPSAGVANISDMENAFALAVRQRQLLEEYISKQLRPGKHFYSRGDQKPSLSKEGAEIILLPHALAPDYDLVSGPDEPPEDDRPYQITVKCTLRKKGDPTSFVGSAVGSAGSHKGTWQYNPQTRKKDWVYQPRQTDKYLCHNATLKMAQKSAMIAATINSTAASEFFTQDMEPTEPGAPEPPKPDPKPKARKQFTVAECRKTLIDKLTDEEVLDDAYSYLVSIGWLLDTESVAKMEDRYVPLNPQQYDKFMAGLEKFVKEGEAEKPYEPNFDNTKPNVPRGTSDDATEPPGGWQGAAGGGGDWRDVEVPFGKDKGLRLGDMKDAKLKWWCENFEVKTEFEGKDGKMIKVKPEKLEADKAFRDALDEAAIEMQW